MNRIVIDSVTRIEGHAKITLHMGDDGKVADARHEFANREGAMPDARQLAAELGMTLTRYRHQVDRMHATAVRSEATPFNEDEDSPA
mgnify:CR=1 FL=1